MEHPFISNQKEINQKLDQLLSDQDLKQKVFDQYAVIDNRQLMKLFNISSKTAKNWRDEGLLPYCKIRKTYYYKIVDVQRLIDETYTAKKKSK